MTEVHEEVSCQPTHKAFCGHLCAQKKEQQSDINKHNPWQDFNQGHYRHLKLHLGARDLNMCQNEADHWQDSMTRIPLPPKTLNITTTTPTTTILNPPPDPHPFVKQLHFNKFDVTLNKNFQQGQI